MTDKTRHKTKHPGITYRHGASGRIYIVAYTDQHNKARTRHCPPGSTLEDARILRGTLLARKAAGEIVTKTNKTVPELLDWWLEIRRPSVEPKTIKDFEYAISVVTKHLGSPRVNAVGASDIARLIATLQHQEGYSKASVNKLLSPLKGAYQIAVREGWVSSSPLTKLLPHERPKGETRLMRCLKDKSEIQRLLRATESQNHLEENHRWKALFALMVFTGLRPGEALALEWGDIGEVVSVRKTNTRDTTKTPAGIRQVPLTMDTRSVLLSWKLKQAPGIQFVFGTQENGSCSRREALRALQATCLRAGLPQYTLYELRHTYASILISQGEPITLIAKLMGHKDPGVTLKYYAHLFEAKESIVGARDRLQDAMGGIV